MVEEQVSLVCGNESKSLVAYDFLDLSLWHWTTPKENLLETLPGQKPFTEILHENRKAISRTRATCHDRLMAAAS
jgi:hypothetical protein